MNQLLKMSPILVGLVSTALAGNCADKSGEPRKHYNFLFIAVDDLNDWTGFLGGHPQTKTPNMDRLAKQGVVFTKAYCAAPVCNPSRAALMTGYRPATSGIYDNGQYMRDSEILKDALTLPQYLSKNGYYTMARGKIFHTANGMWSDSQSWDLHVNTEGGYGERKKQPGLMANGMPNGAVGANFDWGPTNGKLEETTDYLTAKWAGEQLQKDYDKPFFLGCGIFRPHLEWFVPQQFFDKFNVDDMILPLVNENDYNDVPKSGFTPSPDYYATKKYGKQKEAVRAYLACINYADSCIGVVLDALAKSKYADNTIVVLWGDHGWHLGEKLRYKKFTLWEEATRMPLIIKVPGMTNPGSRCGRTVNLLDVYPTITELAGVPKNTTNEGRSIVPLLKNTDKKWNYPSQTTMGKDRHAVRDERYRYIRYQDGAEELYDHKVDSMEWNNLANNPKYNKIKARLSKYMPTQNAPAVPGRKGGGE